MDVFLPNLKSKNRLSAVDTAFETSASTVADVNKWIADNKLSAAINTTLMNGSKNNLKLDKVQLRALLASEHHVREDATGEGPSISRVVSKTKSQLDDILAHNLDVMSEVVLVEQHEMTTPLKEYKFLENVRIAAGESAFLRPSFMISNLSGSDLPSPIVMARWIISCCLIPIDLPYDKKGNYDVNAKSRHNIWIGYSFWGWATDTSFKGLKEESVSFEGETKRGPGVSAGLWVAEVVNLLSAFLGLNDQLRSNDTKAWQPFPFMGSDLPLNSSGSLRLMVDPIVAVTDADSVRAAPTLIIEDLEGPYLKSGNKVRAEWDKMYLSLKSYFDVGLAHAVGVATFRPAATTYGLVGGYTRVSDKSPMPYVAVIPQAYPGGWMSGARQNFVEKTNDPVAMSEASWSRKAQVAFPALRDADADIIAAGMPYGRSGKFVGESWRSGDPGNKWTSTLGIYERSLPVRFWWALGWSSPSLRTALTMPNLITNDAKAFEALSLSRPATDLAKRYAGKRPIRYIDGIRAIHTIQSHKSERSGGQPLSRPVKSFGSGADVTAHLDSSERTLKSQVRAVPQGVLPTSSGFEFAVNVQSSRKVLVANPDVVFGVFNTALAMELGLISIFTASRFGDAVSSSQLFGLAHPLLPRINLIALRAVCSIHYRLVKPSVLPPSLADAISGMKGITDQDLTVRKARRGESVLVQADQLGDLAWAAAGMEAILHRRVELGQGGAEFAEMSRPGASVRPTRASDAAERSIRAQGRRAMGSAFSLADHTYIIEHDFLLTDDLQQGIQKLLHPERLRTSELAPGVSPLPRALVGRPILTLNLYDYEQHYVGGRRIPILLPASVEDGFSKD